MKTFEHFCCSRAYEILERAASLNHTKSMELVAQARLFGDYLPQNISGAKEIFDQLALMGSPRGQMVLDLLIL